jgi:hypothetical protein
MLIAVLGVVLLLLRQPASGAPVTSYRASVDPWTSPAIRWPGVTDDMSPPGCLQVIGQPAPTRCDPCPPLWLGGPSVRCISHAQLALLGNPLLGLADLRSSRPCPGLNVVPGMTIDSRAYQRLCALSAGE